MGTRNRVRSTRSRAQREELGRKLLGYSATAGAVLAFGTAPLAEAAIVANTTDQPFDASSGLNVSIDFNGLNGSEFVIGLYDALTSLLVVMPGADGGLRGVIENTVAPGIATDPFDPNALPANYLVGPAFPAGFDTGEINATFDTLATTGGANGNFNPFVGAERFLGVSFQLGGQRHFGWIGIQLNPDLVSGIVTGYAFEDQPGVAILTGQQQVVPEPPALVLLAAGAAGLLALRRRQKQNPVGIEHHEA